MVEMLFSKGYIKLLVATETFAVGVNMPAKTVIFTALTKFDGSRFRNLLSHEYTQMAGRAGRRGIDTVGHVVHLNNLFELPYVSDYKTILGGTPQSLRSKFRIDYNLMLRLISTTPKAYDSFIGKSMLHDEIKSELDGYKYSLTTLQEDIASKTRCLSYTNIGLLKS